MKSRIAILLAAWLVTLGGPAWGIKVVPKDGGAQEPKKETTQQAPAQGQATNPQSPSEKAAEPAKDKVEPPKDKDKGVSTNPVKIKPPVIVRDRFIDEDGDGLNDKLSKPPEIIKKKKDSGSESSDRKSDRKSERQSEKEKKSERTSERSRRR